MTAKMQDGKWLPGVQLPAVTELTDNGIGGSYYNTYFNVPVYDPDAQNVFNSTSYSDLDFWHKGTVNSAVCFAVGFGICAITLLNILVLTPNAKRALPLTIYNCLGLVCEMARLMANIAIYNHGPTKTAYGYITNDFNAIPVAGWYWVCTVLGHVGAMFSYLFTMLCFYIQCRGLMTPIKLSHRRIYNSIVFTLVSLSIGTFILRTVYGIVEIYGNIYHLKVWAIEGYPMYLVWLGYTLNKVTIAAYGVTIGGCSAIYFIQSTYILYSRRKLLVDSNSPYNSALSMIGLIGVESFFLPLLFCILQAIPNQYMAEPEALIVPSVLCLFPIGSLFLTVNRGITSPEQLRNQWPTPNSSGASTQPLRRPYQYSETSTGNSDFRSPVSARTQACPQPADPFADDWQPRPASPSYHEMQLFINGTPRGGALRARPGQAY